MRNTLSRQCQIVTGKQELLNIPPIMIPSNGASEGYADSEQLAELWQRPRHLSASWGNSPTMRRARQDRLAWCTIYVHRHLL